ncbi:MAG: hypothetical protein ACE5H4_10575 [Candidatus Thorarchaeota archaeon]
MHKKYLAIGTVLLLVGFTGNLFLMWLLLSFPMGGPPLGGTGIILLVPIGIYLVIYSIIVEEQE